MKQRLIGAAVLVALAVIFLPMLIDGPQPETAADSVSLDMPPSPQPGREVREIPLNLPVLGPGSGQPPATPPTREPERLPTVDLDSAVRADALAEGSGNTPVPQEPAVPVDAAPAPAPAEAPGAAVTGAPAPAPVAASTAEPGSAGQPAAVPTPVPASPLQGGFAVNLGVFAQASNAEALRARLAKAGFPVLAESLELEGKPATRLRAGPYATRAEAERARVLVNQTEAGLKGSVVALDPEPAEDAPADAIDTRAAGWAVQVGAFAAEADAVALRDRLRGGGHPAFVERVPTDKGELFRVRVGPELRRPAADALKATLKQRFGLEGIVVAHP